MVRLIDHDAVHLIFNVEIVTLSGKFRASVAVARQLLGDQRLRTWSDAEVAFLFFMGFSVPRCHRLKSDVTWHVMACERG